MIEVILAYELGIFGTSSCHAIADVENDQSIAPVGEISETVFDLQIVEITAAGHRSLFGVNADDGGILRFPASHLFGMFRILEIDNAQRSRRVVGDVDVVSINVRA